MSSTPINLSERINTEETHLPRPSFVDNLDRTKAWLSNSLASVKLTIFLLSLAAVFVLLGAWCPQISQAGEEKVFEQFGEQTGQFLINLGVADIFHSPAFLLLIGFLTVNIIFGSFQHVFPKLKLLKMPMPWLIANQILKMPVHNQFLANATVPNMQNKLVSYLNKNGYKVRVNAYQITAEQGKFGRLAPTVTHIGLLTLLAGVIWTSLTGFSGFKPVLPGQVFQLDNAEHSKMWIGKLPKWSASVTETHREDYPSGEAKQWYSSIAVRDSNGKLVKEETISVNNPLSYEGVDIYQSSWALKSLKIRFGNELKTLSLQSMGRLFAAFLPLPDQAVLIFSVRDAQSPLRIFAKRKDWPAPKLLTQILPNKTTNLGNVAITYEGTIAQTGLQYKCDPGLPIVFVAFIFIIGGISLAAVPHKQIWAQLEENDSHSTVVTIGGTTKKGKVLFVRQIARLVDQLQG